GLDAHIGSVEVGKLADLVLWDPGFFGVRPRLVLKGGVIAWAPIGDANASIPTPQPVLARPMFAAAPAAAPPCALSFVPAAAVQSGLGARVALGRQLVAVADTRGVGKDSMPNNNALPDIQVDPETFVVTVDGERVDPEPATELPLAQRYALF